MAVGVQSFDEGTRLRAIRGLIEDPRWALRGIGALMVSYAQLAFKQEKMGGIRWKNREETGMVPNWPGVLADFDAGKSEPRKHRLERGNTLQDTGRLLSSIAFRPVAADTVEVGSMLPYAGVLHGGGESQTVAISASIQKALGDWIAKMGSRAARATKRRDKAKGTEKEGPLAASRERAQMKSDMAEQLSWLLSPGLTGEKLAVKHPARPIVGVPPDLVKDVEKLYGTTIGAI